MAETLQVRRTVYQKTTGDGGRTVSMPVEMYAIDAHNAVINHSNEYSYKPWDDSEGVNLLDGTPRPMVPNDWLDMKPSDKLALARQLGAKDIRSGAAAEDFINEYLVDRANAGATDNSRLTSDRPAAELREQARSQTTEESTTGKTVENRAPSPVLPVNDLKG